MRRVIIALLLAYSAAAGASSAVFPPLNLGLGNQLEPNPAPLALPTATHASSIFTFLGSFKVNTNSSVGISIPSGALSVSGNTLYMSANLYDPADTSHNEVAYGEGAITLPTLTGTPAYDGTNVAGTVSASIVPTGPMNFTAAANYTATTTPTTGIKTITFSSVPAGIAANAGWYAYFQLSTGGNASGADEPITGVSGNTLSWTNGLPTHTYGTTVAIHQWVPTYPFGNASGERLTGSLPYGGNLYITGAAYYGTAGAWIQQANTSLTTFGQPYSTSGPVGTDCTGSSGVAYSRRYAGAMNQVPAIWQTLLGGPAYVTGGPGMSVLGDNIEIGFAFSVFDPSTIGLGGGSASVTQLTDYCYEGLLGQRWKKSLNARKFTGPFPLTASTYYPATLSSAPSAGATSLTIAVPSGTVTATASVTSGSNNLVVTAINSGTLSNSYESYTTGGAGTGIPTADDFDPGLDLGPGVAVNCSVATPCTFILHTPATANETNESLTFTPVGYFNAGLTGYFQVCILSSSECRVGHVTHGTGNIAFPSTPGGTDNLDSLTFSPALACVPSCGTAITIAPMGDQWVSTYDGPVGTAFILPGSRSLLFLSMHQYGPVTVRDDKCAGGQSGSNEFPLPPDTSYYVQEQVTAFDMQDIINAKNGVASNTNCPDFSSRGAQIGPYEPCPYDTWAFPDSAKLQTTSTPAVGCLNTVSGAAGWAYYDPVKSILYEVFRFNNYTPTGAGGIVYEWSVAPL